MDNSLGDATHLYGRDHHLTVRHNTMRVGSPSSNFGCQLTIVIYPQDSSSVAALHPTLPADPFYADCCFFLEPYVHTSMPTYIHRSTAIYILYLGECLLLEDGVGVGYHQVARSRQSGSARSKHPTLLDVGELRLVFTPMMQMLCAWPLRTIPQRNCIRRRQGAPNPSIETTTPDKGLQPQQSETQSIGNANLKWNARLRKGLFPSCHNSALLSRTQLLLPS